MRKFQKFEKSMAVEMVENFQELLSWISTTITFWDQNKNWPTNLIKDACDEYHDNLEDLKQDLLYNKIN